MKLPFQFNRRTLLIVLMALSVVGCALPAGVSNYLRGRLDLILSPLADGGTYVTTTLRGRASSTLHWRPGSAEVARAFPDPDAAVEEVASFWRHRMELQRDLYAQDLIQRGLMKGFYERYADFPCELIPARVVASNAVPYEQGRTIQAAELPAGAMVTTRELYTGVDSPLPEKLAVLSTTGLVGQIASSEQFTARLRLVTDRGFKLPAQIVRDPSIERRVIVPGLGGGQSVPLTPANNAPIDVTIKGDGARGVVIDDVPFDHAVAPGDWILTRGHSLEMPGRVRIAQIKKVTIHKSNSLMRVVYAEPYVDLSTLRDAYIVRPLTPPTEGPR